jgi:hypothetical protein
MRDPMLEEIYEVRRKLWQEGGSTLEGFSRHCEAVAREFGAARRQGAAKRLTGLRRKAPSREKHEGVAP